MPLLTPSLNGLFDGPRCFLVGPVRSATDWQAEAALQLEALRPGLWVVSPRRPEQIDLQDKLDDETYVAQVEWETDQLARTAEYGVILFWLAREHEHLCRRAFAQTARFELAEWVTRHKYEGTPIVIGIEAGFPGTLYIRHRVSRECPQIPILETLEDTCRAAARLLERYL